MTRSGLDIDDLDLENASRCLEVDNAAHRATHQGNTKRRTRSENLEFAVAFLDRADQEALDLVIALVANADNDPRDHRGTIGGFDDFGIKKKGFKLADSSFHLALLLLSGVVIAIFGEIAHFPGGLDLSGDIDPTMGREQFALSAQPVEGLLGELVNVGHRRSVPVVRGTRLGG